MSGELVVMDQETKKIKFVRTVRRIPLEQRWEVGNLEWVRVVPWSMGNEDAEADGEVLEFDLPHGSGTMLTKGELEEIMSQEKLQTVHKAHLKKIDFEKYVFHR